MLTNRKNYYCLISGRSKFSFRQKRKSFVLSYSKNFGRCDIPFLTSLFLQYCYIWCWNALSLLLLCAVVRYRSSKSAFKYHTFFISDKTTNVFFSIWILHVSLLSISNIDLCPQILFAKDGVSLHT